MLPVNLQKKIRRFIADASAILLLPVDEHLPARCPLNEIIRTKSKPNRNQLNGKKGLVPSQQEIER
jgi:hypothetical protein